LRLIESLLHPDRAGADEALREKLTRASQVINMIGGVLTSGDASLAKAVQAHDEYEKARRSDTRPEARPETKAKRTARAFRPIR
jgi:hypothetical protein